MSTRIRPSRMEIMLLDKMTGARTQLLADCAESQLAAYWARTGRLKEAEEKIFRLRQRNILNPKVELSAWLHFSEGLLAYFGNDGVTDADGIQRAYALSVAAGLVEMRALCAAWLAQWDYTKVDISSLFVHVQEALKFASPDNHACRSRAALVVAQTLHLAGRLDLARKWYELSREHAIAGFDGATIGALMHNMAWQRMLLFRQGVLAEEANLSAGRGVLMSAESATHFNELTGDLSWPNLQPILRAQIFSLSGDSSSALYIYEQSLTRQNVPGRWQANLLADKAWCHAALMQVDQAEICAHAAVANIVSDTQVDDCAATHSRLSQTYTLLGDLRKAEYHKLLANAEWKAFKNKLYQAVVLLSTLDAHGVATEVTSL